MHKIDPQTLETKEKVHIYYVFFFFIKYVYMENKLKLKCGNHFDQVDWSKFIAVNGATAHPHVDPDGTTYNMGNSYTPKGLSKILI